MFSRAGMGVLATVGALVIALALLSHLFHSGFSRADLEQKYASAPSRFITVDGVRFHYRVRGADGLQPLLLLHGADDSLFAWEAWSRGLAGFYRVISVDLPGYGLTGAIPSADHSLQNNALIVGRFADALGLRQFAVAGNSFGGAVALQLAAGGAGRIPCLILVDVAIGKNAPASPFSWLQDWKARLLPGRTVRRALDAAISNKAVMDAAFVSRHVDFSRLKDRARINADRQSSAIRTSLRFPDPHLPVLILWGANDPSFTPAAAKVLSRAFPAAQTIVYAGAGHFPQLETPQRSMADARAFLQANWR